MSVANEASASNDELGRWMSVYDFQNEANEGRCWIVYKGRVVEAYHDHAQRFRFHRMSANCYMTECVSMVMPWRRPCLPSNAGIHARP